MIFKLLLENFFKRSSDSFNLFFSASTVSKSMVLAFVLAAFCWTKSLLCNVAAFTGMLLYPESTLQLCPSRRFCEVFYEVHFSSLSTVRTMWYSFWTLISQQHPSGRRGIMSGRLSVKASSVRKTRTFRPNDVVFRPDAHLSKHHPSRRRELSVRTPISV
jgi:hypothetical protein